MKRKDLIEIVMLFIILSILTTNDMFPNIIVVEGLEYETRYIYQEYSVNLTTDDVELGGYQSYNDNGIISYLRHPYADVRLGYRFTNITKPFTNCTLESSKVSLRKYDVGFESEETVYSTIYGLEENNPQTFTNASDFVSRPYTDQHINWNIANIFSSEWENTTDLNEIVGYLINNVWTNNTAIGFVMLSASGDDYRYCSTFDRGIAYAPKLYIVWKYQAEIKPITTLEFVKIYKGYAVYRNLTRTFSDPYFIGINYENQGFEQCTQGKTFHAQGLFWIFFYNNTDFWYVTFNEATQTLGNITLATHIAHQGSHDSGDSISIFYHEGLNIVDTAYLAQADTNSAIIYRRGTPYANGSIVWLPWSSAELGNNQRPSISVSEDGYPWIMYRDWSVSKRPFITTSDTNDGTWSVRAGFPYQLESWTTNTWNRIGTLANNTIYAMYFSANGLEGRLWNGSWGVNEDINGTASLNYGFSSIAVGNNVHAFYLDDEKKMKYTTRYYSNHSWTGHKTISIMNQTGLLAEYDFDAGAIYLTYNDANENAFYYRSINPSNRVVGNEIEWFEVPIRELQQYNNYGGSHYVSTEATIGYSTNTSSPWEMWLITKTFTSEYHYFVFEGSTLIASCFPTEEDTDDWIDDYDHKKKFEPVGDWMIFWMGMIGLLMIPLGFILFVLDMQKGEFENAFFMLMVLVIMGIGLVTVWLFG